MKKLLTLTITTLMILTILIGVKYINVNDEYILAYTENYTTEEYSFTIKNTKIIIEENLDAKIIEQYFEILKTMPKKLLKECNSITFTNRELSEIAKIDTKAKVVAITIGNDVYIESTSFRKNAIVHELFHSYDYSNDWLSTSPDFMKIYHQEKEAVAVSPGNIQNNFEFIASCVELYVYDNEKLKEVAPLTYEYIEKLNIF